MPCSSWSSPPPHPMSWCLCSVPVWPSPSLHAIHSETCRSHGYYIPGPPSLGTAIFWHNNKMNFVVPDWLSEGMGRGWCMGVRQRTATLMQSQLDFLQFPCLLGQSFDILYLYTILHSIKLLLFLELLEIWIWCNSHGNSYYILYFLK